MRQNPRLATPVLIIGIVLRQWSEPRFFHSCAEAISNDEFFDQCVEVRLNIWPYDNRFDQFGQPTLHIEALSIGINRINLDCKWGKIFVGEKLCWKAVKKYAPFYNSIATDQSPFVQSLKFCRGFDLQVPDTVRQSHARLERNFCKVCRSEASWNWIALHNHKETECAALLCCPCIFST